MKHHSDIYAKAAADALRDERTDMHRQAKVHMPKLPEPPSIGFTHDEPPILKALGQIMVAGAILGLAWIITKVLGVHLQ